MVTNLLDARLRNVEDLALAIAERVRKLEASRGIAGTGACICKASPESVVSELDRMRESWETNSKSRFPKSAWLDHRCPKHGEKAQPTLWGRHKEKELQVTYAQWNSLGVKHEETKT